MNVYICTDHARHWPVGAASVVVANSEHEARSLLTAALHERGLQDKPFTFKELDLSLAKAFVLCDGNY